jgi:hypothetical protein
VDRGFGKLALSNVVLGGPKTAVIGMNNDYPLLKMAHGSFGFILVGKRPLLFPPFHVFQKPFLRKIVSRAFGSAPFLVCGPVGFRA